MRQAKVRGVVLLQVLVIIMIMAIIAAALLSLSFGRTLMVAQQRNSLMARALAEGATLKMQNCLTINNWVPPPQCNNIYLPVGCSVGIKDLTSQTFTIGSVNYTVAVTVSGSSPNCILKATCQNCM